MKNLKKKAVTMLAVLVAVSVTSVPAFAAAPGIVKAEYEGRGKVEVDFKGKVNYKNVKVTVKDSNGKVYTAKILDKDSDDLEFQIKNFKCDRNYQYQISGVKKRNDTKYGTVKGSVKIPNAKTITVKKVKGDVKDQEVEFDFITHVNWNKPVVTIKDANGKKLSTRISEKDSDELEVNVGKLKKGGTYTYEISGIKNVDAKSYRTIQGTFKTGK